MNALLLALFGILAVFGIVQTITSYNEATVEIAKLENQCTEQGERGHVNRDQTFHPSDGSTPYVHSENQLTTLCHQAGRATDKRCNPQDAQDIQSEE